MNNDAFLILFIAFIAMMGVGPLLLRRLGIPAVISLLIVGMLVGPNCLDVVGMLSRMLGFLGGSSEVVAGHFNSLIDSLGSLGLVFLMALAGMEADFKLIRAARTPVIALSLLTFLRPAIAGFFVYAHFRPEDFPGKLLYASLFASHSVGIVFPVIRELKLSKSRFGAAVLISTVITDIASIILLAVSVQLKRQSIGAAAGARRTLSIFDYVDPAMFGSWFTPVFLLIVLLYLAAAVFVVYHLGRKLLKICNPGEDMLITILLLVILATVLVGEFLGVNLVVGAFIAGLALSRLVQQRISEHGGSLIGRFESIGYGLLIPFLFVSIGMDTDFKAFGAAGNLEIILLTVAGLVVSKVASGWLAMRLAGFNNWHGVAAGLMTVPQLSATLAAAAIGKELGMLDNQFFNAIIILSIVTTLPVPSLVRWIISRRSAAFHESEDEESYPDPMPNAAAQEDLL